MSAQFIEHNGQPEYAVVPFDEYRALLEKAEALDDIAAFDAVKATLETGEDELVPAEIFDALMDGENPLKVWRGHRGLTQQQIADTAGVKQSYIAQIESGKKKGSVDILSRLAEILAIDVDDLI